MVRIYTTTETGTTSRTETTIPSSITITIFEESETKSGITTSSTTEPSMMLIETLNEEEKLDDKDIGGWIETWVFATQSYHKRSKFYGCDKSKNAVIFGVFWNFGDLYSGLMFTMTLVLIPSYLWYCEARFVIVAHFSGNIITIILISKWYNQCVYILKCIQKYDWILIRMSLLASIYASIELYHDQNISFANVFFAIQKNRIILGLCMCILMVYLLVSSFSLVSTLWNKEELMYS